jgi:hypothetical protein
MDATHDDCPLNLPAPRVLADACMARAWDDDTHDRERLLLEQAALTITRLLARLAMVAEHAEAKATQTRRHGAAGNPE